LKKCLPRQWSIYSPTLNNGLSFFQLHHFLS
jgi:hypothetical protein